MGASPCKTYPHKFLASRTQYWDHKTAINFSRLESFAIYIALFRTFSLLGHMLSENASSDDVETQQPSEEFLAQLLRLCVIDQVTQTVPKKRSKSGLYSVQGKIGIFWCRKNHRNRGKIVAAWQYHVLDRYPCERTSNVWFGTFHEAFSLWMWVSLKAEGKHMC